MKKTKSQKSVEKKITVALGGAFLASAIAPVALSDTVNPFDATELDVGYEVVNFSRHKEHKCGEGKCGGKKASRDHKCGEGKCGG